MFHLQEAGIDCVYFSSGMDWTEQRSSFDRVRGCGSQDTIVLFVTPEKVGAIFDQLIHMLQVHHVQSCTARPIVWLFKVCSLAGLGIRWQPAMR